MSSLLNINFKPGPGPIERYRDDRRLSTGNLLRAPDSAVEQQPITSEQRLAPVSLGMRCHNGCAPLFFVHALRLGSLCSHTGRLQPNVLEAGQAVAQGQPPSSWQRQVRLSKLGLPACPHRPEARGPVQAKFRDHLDPTAWDSNAIQASPGLPTMSEATRPLLFIQSIRRQNATGHL